MYCIYVYIYINNSGKQIHTNNSPVKLQIRINNTMNGLYEICEST